MTVTPFQRQVKLPTLITAAELSLMHFDPLKWIVPYYIPEGVTLLAGKPKVGKSWLMLAAAYAVAQGGSVLSQRCARREVIYFALEDSERRLQERSTKILNGTLHWPDTLHFGMDLPNIDQGGIQAIEHITHELGGIGLIIIDTLAKFRGKRLKEEDQYQCDYRTMNALLDLGRRTGVSIIVVHHVRKQDSDDLFDTISGTLGLNGAADTLAILTRTANTPDLRFATRGRDVEPEDKNVMFDPESGLWIVSGDYVPGVTPSISPDVNRVLGCVSEATSSVSPEQVSQRTNLDLGYCQTTLNRLARQGKIFKTGYGSYAKNKD